MCDDSASRESMEVMNLLRNIGSQLIRIGKMALKHGLEGRTQGKKATGHEPFGEHIL